MSEESEKEFVLRRIIRELLEWDKSDSFISNMISGESFEQYLNAFLEGRLKIHYDPEFKALLYELSAVRKRGDRDAEV